MSLRHLTFAVVLCLSFDAVECAAERDPRWEWAGEGAVRVVVKVSEVPAGRVGDERPAEVVIDFEKLLAGIGPGRRPDLSTLQVIRHDPATGAPVESVRFAFGRGKFDVPCRWYDDEIGYEFPEVFHAVSSTGEVPR